MGMFMDKLSIFMNMSNDEINDFLKSLGARKISFKKDRIIFANLASNDLIGIMLEGIANIIKYDYDGNRSILDTLEYDNVFGKPFSYNDSDISIVAASDCEILFLDYSLLISNDKYQKVIKNINSILTERINTLYEKVEVLSKRTIKDKLLCYFNMLSKKRNRKTFNLPITYIELADLLSVDRSAMMREIKKLKDNKIISVDGKKVTIK